MPSQISIAQAVYDRIRKERVLDSESHGLLSELRGLVKDFPEALSAIDFGLKHEGAGIPAVSMALAYLANWADRVLSADPSELSDFSRWSRHLAGIEVSRKNELLKHVGLTDGPLIENQDHATRIIDVARRLGIRVGVVKLPEEPITTAELWNIIDKLCLQLPPKAENIRAASVSDGTTPRRRRISAAEANVKARDYLRNNPNATVRELSRGIGCASGMVSKLPAWKAVNEQRDKRKAKRATVVNLSPTLERIVGIEDESLAKLVGEQQADAEPSPLIDDPFPSPREEGAPRKARLYRKR